MTGDEARAKLRATLDSGGHALFVERLGTHRTLDLIYSGRLMTGAEAVAAGLLAPEAAERALTTATITHAGIAEHGHDLDAWLATRDVVLDWPWR